MAMKWSNAKRRKQRPLTEQEIASKELTRKASGLLGERLLTGREIIAKVRSHHAKPPQILVAQVAAYLITLHPPNHTEPWSRTIVRAERAMERAHYPGLERRGSAWVIRTKDHIDSRRRKRASSQFTGEPDPSVPPVGVQGAEGITAE